MLTSIFGDFHYRSPNFTHKQANGSLRYCFPYFLFFPPPWLADYDRILNAALSAYSNRDFARAKQEYNRALALANRNGDRQKASFVSGQITECDKAIEAKCTIDDALYKISYVKLKIDYIID